jgi:hypothetical protein
VTERGLPLADGAPACPFVAFEDDRDERASVPDHRHRCYADQQPAPRALAHQEAYCLSSAFPVCPTFQDWARREAARSRGGTATAPSASAGMNRAASGAAADASAAAGGAGAAAVTGAASDAVSRGADVDERRVGADDDDRGRDPGVDDDDRRGRGADDDDLDDDDVHGDDLVRRNPPRDWAAPPPWLASRDARRDDSAPPPFLGRRTPEPGQGLAGSPADRMAGGPPPRHDDPDEGDGDWSSDSRSAAAVGAGLAAGSPAARAGRRPPTARDDAIEDLDEEGGRPARRSRAYAQHLGGTDGPDWERPRRYEAYPTIKTRVGLPAVPRIFGLVGLVIVLALALFFLPGILNLGGGTAAPGGSTAPSVGPGPSVSVAPTEPAAPTPIIYTIKHGDTLSKIATAHGITIEELLAANKSIKNANKISEGQQITIPPPSADPGTIDGSATP